MKYWTKFIGWLTKLINPEAARAAQVVENVIKAEEARKAAEAQEEEEARLAEEAHQAEMAKAAPYVDKAVKGIIDDLVIVINAAGADLGEALLKADEVAKAQEQEAKQMFIEVNKLQEQLLAKQRAAADISLKAEQLKAAIRKLN